MGKVGDGCGHTSRRRRLKHSLVFVKNPALSPQVCKFESFASAEETCTSFRTHIEPSPSFHPPCVACLRGAVGGGRVHGGET